MQLEANQIRDSLSLLPWHPFERAEGEDEMLNISGLGLPAATEPVATSSCHICLLQLCGAMLGCSVLEEEEGILFAFLKTSDKGKNGPIHTYIWDGK